MKELKMIQKKGYVNCECGGLVDSESDWLGEDKNGNGRYRVYYTCDDCGATKTVIESE